MKALAYLHLTQLKNRFKGLLKSPAAMISIRFLFIILFGYAIISFCGQLTAMVLYSFTVGSERKRGIVQTGLIAICSVFVLYVLLSVYTQRGPLLSELVMVAGNFPVTLFPVGGWAQAMVVGLWTEDWIKFFGGFAVLSLYVGAFFIIMIKVKSDFYEDVLQSTEETFSAITASKEGRIDAAIPQNIKLGQTGIRKGFGADSFYYKHRLESRRAKIFILDRTSLLFLIVNIVFALFMRRSGIYPVFAFATYMQLFSVATGRWIRELLLPYIYIVPETAFIKLLHCLRESLLRLAIEAFILFIPIAFLLKLSFVETVICIFARISFGLLFTGGNIFVERFFSGVVIKTVAVIIYFFVMILLIAPGVILAFILAISGVDVLSETIQVFVTMTICNLILSLFVFYLCRNMLEYAELNHR